jgi:hypothetical protein
LKRSEFEHAIRAAGAILATDRVLVIGSQAIHGSMDELFEEAERSIEVDVASLGKNAEYSADLIDGSIGELSMFQSTFGYYVQGVTPDTAVLPKGWRKRLVPFNSAATNGVTALCLELHDLWLSKAVANRAKDKEFCRALITRKLVDSDTLHTRLKQVPGLDKSTRESIRAWIDKIL